MLEFSFEKEHVGDEITLRPRVRVVLGKRAKVSALLDSGADRTIVPQFLANILRLPVGRKIKTRGVGGLTEGHESSVTMTLVDKKWNVETIEKVPAYVLPNVPEVVIGRKTVFDNYSILFDKPRITFELKS